MSTDITTLLSEAERLEQERTPGSWQQVNRFPLHITSAQDAMKPMGGSVSPDRDARYAQVIAEVQEAQPFDGCEQFAHRRFDKAKNAADAAFIAFWGTHAPAILARVRELEHSLEQERLKHDVACATIRDMQCEREHRDSYVALSNISSLLGQGLGNAKTTAAEFESRIHEGIDFITKVEVSRREQAEARVRELEMKHPKLKDRKGADPSEWPERLRVREFPQEAR